MGPLADGRQRYLALAEDRGHCPFPEFREIFFEIWAVAGFANFASKFGQIWRTAVFREMFVVRYRRRIDGYTHSPLSSRFLEERKVGGSHGLCPHMHICCVRPCEWVFSKVNTMFGEDQLSVLAD